LINPSSVNQDLPDVDERKLLMVSVTLQAEREKSSRAAPAQRMRMWLGCVMTMTLPNSE
jgi:hypothetical protein